VQLASDLKETAESEQYGWKLNNNNSNKKKK